MIRLSPRFAELATTTNFRSLRGASHPEELVARAAELGLAGIGIADRNTLAGVVRAHVFARENRGADRGFARRHGGAAGLCRRHARYARLPQGPRRLWAAVPAADEGNLRAPKGECHLNFEDVLEHGEGCRSSRCRLIRPRATLSRKQEKGEARASRNCASLRRSAFDRREPDLWRGHARRAGQARRAGAKAGAPLLATNDALMHVPERRALADVVACIREGVTMEAAGRLIQANAERHLKDAGEMARLFAEAPRRSRRRSRFLDGLTFSLDELAHSYPQELREGYPTPQAALEAFTRDGARARYPDGVPDSVRAALAHELALIGQLNYAPYFLTVHDIVRFARTRGILCQGRGSAANSTVCFCLGSPGRSRALRSAV